MKVIIPSAKLVPERLQYVGQLPAIIYPVNEGIVFDYLYNQYKEIADEIIIICYENAQMVHHRLSKYSDKKIRILDLNSIEDLGYTIYFGLEDLSEPVIINFADTIVSDEVKHFKDNYFFYSEEYPSKTWTFFEESYGIINQIYDKTVIESTNPMKMFVGVFCFSDAYTLKQCIKEVLEKSDISTDSFYSAIIKYNHTYKLYPIKASQWFDLGHVEKYSEAALEVKARTFNHITIDRNRGILRKTSDNKEKFIGEIKWYLKLPNDIEYVRPRIFSFSYSFNDPYIEMEYYDYHTLHELYLYGDLSINQWRDIFTRIKFIMRDFSRYTVKDEKILPSLIDMYYTKTISRLCEINKQDKFSTFFTAPIIINDVKYFSLNEIQRILSKEISKRLYDTEIFHIIHGDLCFSNIMIDSNFSFIKVIDPRGEFGEFDIYGDTRYELAKLFQCADGKYDYIIKDFFDIEISFNTNHIVYRIWDKKCDYNLFDVLQQIFNDEIGVDFENIELIEALLFFSMIPLHGENINHQFAMLVTGIQLVDRIINIRVE